ncbi:MAG: nucleotide exchange factor GrpE [Clostridia bacterium]|nr:nucleotide exchange factor GrpE [Clostridia bacterium]
MAKKIKDQENPEVKEEKVTEATENAAEETKETEAPAEEAKEEKKDDKVTSLEKELADEKDRFLRLAAEYDNFRKRTQKEKDRMYSDAVIKTVGELLPTLDNLERAIGAAEDKEDNFYKGVELTLKTLKEEFSKLGVTEIESAPGTAFDPNVHEAIMHEDDGSGENVIAETFRKGYTREGTIVRPALVKTRG